MALENLFGELALDATLTGPIADLLAAIQRGLPAQVRRLDWQTLGSENYPLYIGVAPVGTLPEDPEWAIERYTFDVGPGGGYVPVVIETATGAWNDRATLF